MDKTVLHYLSVGSGVTRAVIYFLIGRLLQRNLDEGAHLIMHDVHISVLCSAIEGMDTCQLPLPVPGNVITDGVDPKQTPEDVE